ncbi:uncharacterized protein YprB with RNaseH-like and TPR domain [Clostridium algifaecis]|uniref:Uncharacterized protein YprB with RNaseH-like and TPR domain n=1 Tax=Clostridium algifaecis TaxID=1472040 RepID=A0ABS4KP03_9CLOT|nr:uncharacterized protein YprB with RNaseH-like and TPR domain [Clostridium algifaecis]
MIERHNSICVSRPKFEEILKVNGNIFDFKDALFFDLEHYIYRKPICIGVFGCCIYNCNKGELEVTQYMIENKDDSNLILKFAEDYFINMWNRGKRYIVTFSGNNDFTVINYLFKKYDLKFDILEHFFHIDLQKQYEKENNTSIGLKNLEKEFDIIRESEVISGSNLAKTFSKIMKDSKYINRMPKDKIKKILLYNEQDVVSLFYMCAKWKSVFFN